MVSDEVYFKIDKDVIEEGSFKISDSLAKLLRANPQIKKVRIMGHTDLEGSKKENLELSKKRARVVKAYLVNSGIAAERLIPEGKGSSEPAVKGTNKAANKADRRVEFVIEER